MNLISFDLRMVLFCMCLHCILKNIIKRKYDVKSPAIGSAHVGSILEIGAKIEIMILSTVNMPFS